MAYLLPNILACMSTSDYPTSEPQNRKRPPAPSLTEKSQPVGHSQVPHLMVSKPTDIYSSWFMASILVIIASVASSPIVSNKTVPGQVW